jgi:hypothetical protein
MLFVFERPVKSRVPLRCIKPTLRRQLEFAKLIILENSDSSVPALRPAVKRTTGHARIRRWVAGVQLARPANPAAAPRKWGVPAACRTQLPRSSGTEVAAFRKMDLSSQIEFAIEFTDDKPSRVSALGRWARVSRPRRAARPMVSRNLVRRTAGGLDQRRQLVRTHQFLQLDEIRLKGSGLLRGADVGLRRSAVVRCARRPRGSESCRYHRRSWRRPWAQGAALRRRVAKFQTGSGNTVLHTIHFGPGLLLVRTTQLTPSPVRPSTPRRQISSPNMAVVAGAMR